jgi:hypothetical protein
MFSVKKKVSRVIAWSSIDLIALDVLVVSFFDKDIFLISI